MGSFRGADKHVAGLEYVVYMLSVGMGAHGDAAFELVKNLFGLIVVVVLAGIRACDDHHDVVLRIGSEVFIADGRLELVAVLFEPAVEVENHSSNILR